ncbi:MAG: trehalase family glycosidase, partial [Ktedonobacterales bacterium]
FWARAPRLAGDWPAHFRRGFALDFEALRMVARPAVGVFAGRWDGMQVQAPRAVLAETALDALALAWTDSELARELLLTCFAAAPRPNVPCMREDGSYNMIADDGSICGTGPEWGAPFAVIESLWQRTGDRAWLAALYPHASAYLDWWLTQRADAGGWLVHACSWESGQDVSTRFGTQATGGSDIRTIRPVDLQAASAQACALLAEWATTLARPAAETAHWRDVASRLSAHTRGMWRANWFHDYDAAAGRWSKVRDPMQLAPLAAGLATPQQRQMLRRAFTALPAHGGRYPALVWPPVALTVLEAALACDQGARAAELAAAILDRVWRRMDARTIEPDGALPGVTREFWPEGGAEVPAGIEGYGWGALTTHLLLRYVAGVRECAPDHLRLVPALPAALRRAGASYRVGPLAYGAYTLTVSYRVPAAGEGVEIGVELWGSREPLVARDESTGRELARALPDAGGRAALTWCGSWLRAVSVAPVTQCDESCAPEEQHAPRKRTSGVAHPRSPAPHRRASSTRRRT